jgi:hypothetical protein
MSHTHSNRRKPTARTAIVTFGLLLACLGLAACGGSSSANSTSTNASATTPRGATGGGATGPRGARFKALRECLQKNGITLPQRPSGQREGPPGGPSGPRGFLGGGGAGGPQLPSGVSRAQFQAAIAKCGGGAFAGRGSRLKSPAYLAALTKFAACMREHGVNVPTPNTSGSGPIFSTKGIDTASAQFRAAELKCRSDLADGLRRGPGAGATGAAGAGAPPPSGQPAD